MKNLINSGTFIGLLVLLIVLIVFSNISGCKKDNTTPSEPNPIEITKTGCKTEFLLTDSIKQDCIEYQLIKNILHIKHVNAAFNCCPNKVYALAIISHDSVLITEKEILTQPCKCNCLYDLDYDIPNITDSNYVIVINEPYVTVESDKIIFSLNPVLSSVGSFCKTRSIYPWN
jgi:hypothetical protein